MPYLFSYGTLQQEEVQASSFARKLSGHADELVGFELSSVKIDDPEVVLISRKTNHLIVKFTGKNNDRVAGTVFGVTDVELCRADEYEVGAYIRVTAKLASGLRAWVYVDARFAPPREY